MAEVIAKHGFNQLPISMRHAQVAADVPLHHKDPMDRLLIGQAAIENMTIVTADNAFSSYNVKVLW